MKFFRKKSAAINDRGAAVHQDKNWQRLLLPYKQLFVHCGSAPFAQETDGLMRMKGKEVCKVEGTAETKFILCFPLMNMYPQIVPERMMLSKPCQLLWAFEEMPRGFVFQLPAGTEVWTANGALADGQEVGLAFDVVFEDYLIAQFQRINKSTMQRVNLDGVRWL